MKESYLDPDKERTTLRSFAKSSPYPEHHLFCISEESTSRIPMFRPALLRYKSFWSDCCYTYNEMLLLINTKMWFDISTMPTIIALFCVPLPYPFIPLLNIVAYK